MIEVGAPGRRPRRVAGDADLLPLLDGNLGATALAAIVVD
jgi:hypothetical protein